MERVSSFVRKAVPVAVEAFSRRRILGRFMRQALRAQPAFLVRGSSRRIMSMRFRPANIRVINRRADRLGRHSRCFPLAREKQCRAAPRMYLTGSAISELILQTELENAIGQRRALNLAERPIAEVIVWIRKLRRVERIEKLRSELQSVFLVVRHVKNLAK
jgi:hypothetical protein